MPDKCEDASFSLRDYLYDLPGSLIAQAPAGQRGASRLLVLDHKRDELEHQQFDDICRFFRAGDVLVVNDTRVVPARLHGRKETGGAVELLVLDPYKDADRGSEEGYECLLKSAKRCRQGSRIVLENGSLVEILQEPKDGTAIVRFLCDRPLLGMLQEIGYVPLPPYIHRNGGNKPVDDRKTYQTVYADKPGAVAAPTAGLHFSTDLLRQLNSIGVELVSVTLHVGYGTFAPLRAEDIRNHRMHPEYAEISKSSAQTIETAKKEKRRVIAVGTTVVRTLEWVAAEYGKVDSFSGLCNHYIYPGYRFRVIDGMVTNFHLPGSTLILLVAAFAGRKIVLRAYAEAIEKGYRFYSYGDAMLIL